MSRILSLIVLLIFTSSCDKNKVIYVASTLADCESNSTEKCLQVKENQEDEWTVLNNDIEGFEHKDGFLQKIEVKISKIKNPTSDGAVFNYKFIKLIFEQEEKTSAKLTLDSSYTGTWQVNSMIGMDSLTKQPTMTFKDGNISGNAGCNSYNAMYTLTGDKIAFELSMMTKMYCTDMAIEKAYFECLSKATTYKLEDKLTFYDKDNIALMQCIKQEN